MKSIKIILAIFIFVSSFVAANAQTNNDLWTKASQYYSEKNYEAAIENYEQLLQSGFSAPLYYNYANALYKSGNIGKAILFYERAQKLDPDNEDIQHNINYLNRQKTDKIVPLEKFFISQWIDNLAKIFTSNQWAYLCVILFSCSLALLLTYLFSSRRWLRKTSFFTSLLLLVVSVVSLSYALSTKRASLSTEAAIVMTGSVSVKSAPDNSGTEVFVIHEGTKVFIKSELSTWSEVSLEDGSVGWLPTETIESI